MNRLVCFSATKNTYGLAEQISGFLSGGFGIHGIDENINFAGNDRTVFLCPVYNLNIAEPVKRFISSLNGAGSKALLICSYGSVNAGKALQNALVLLRRRGFDAIGGITVPMPHSYNGAQFTAGSFPDTETIKKTAYFILNADKDGFTYRTERSFRLRKTPSACLPQRLIGRITCKIIRNNDKCVKCGGCINICPVKAADINGKKCVKCGACVKECAYNALELKFLTKSAVNYIKRRGKKAHAPSFYISDGARLKKIIF